MFIVSSIISTLNRTVKCKMYPLIRVMHTQRHALDMAKRQKYVRSNF